MKNINFSFGNDDVTAISCALSVLPSYDFFDSCPSSVIYMPTAVITKLHKHVPLTQRELYIVAVAVDSAYKALRGELSIEEEALSELQPYLFIINKLQPSLSLILDSE